MTLDLDVRYTTIAAILVVFAGAWLTRRVRFLSDYNIPEPVSGGLVAALLLGLQPWPGSGPTLALVSQISLNLFLAMSMMSIDVATLAGLALPVMAIVAAQVALVALVLAPLCFRLLGRDFDAAVSILPR